MTADTDVLHVHRETAPALTFAVKRAIDDLAARAIVAEYCDPDLGSLSAIEYRADIPRLTRLLQQLGSAPPRPRPEGGVVRWLDRLYTIANGRPVRIGLLAPFRQLLRQALRSGNVSGAELAAALALAMGTGSDAISRKADPSKTNYTDRLAWD